MKTIFKHLLATAVLLLVSVSMNADGSYTTGIAEIMADRNVAGIYSIDGKRLSRPQRGLNIIRMKDGTVKRVMVK